jgi:hypothetical protein
MAVFLGTVQLLAAAGLIFASCVIGWRSGEKYWSSRR